MGVGLSGGFSIEEREELLDHIEKLSEENNDLLALSDKLGKRSNESVQLLQAKTAE
jgi:hypothetical protein